LNIGVSPAWFPPQCSGCVMRDYECVSNWRWRKLTIKVPDPLAVLKSSFGLPHRTPVPASELTFEIEVKALQLVVFLSK